MNLVKQIEIAISKHDMLHDGDSLLVAVSGGLDSMVLLDALIRLSFPLQVAHVNYQLRGEQSDLDQRLVEDYCKAKSIEFQVYCAELDVTRGIQEQAREVRYAWFEEVCTAKGLAKVAVAHHQADQAETLLFNISRGAGLTGSCGMREVNGRVIRPMLHVSKDDLRDHAEMNEVPYRDDQSNFSDNYARNRIRQTTIPSLESVNKEVVANLDRFTSITKVTEVLVKKIAKDTWDSNSRASDYGCELELTDWSLEPYSELLLHYMLVELGVEPSRTSDVYSIIKSLSGKRVELVNYTVWKDRDHLVFESKLEKKNNAYKLFISEPGHYETRRGKVEVSIMSCPEELVTPPEEILIPLELVKWPLEIRPWEQGDSFQPFGMKGRQKISDFLIQRKVSMVKKKGVSVLVSNDEILWVIGYRSSELARVSGVKEKVIKIVISA